MFKNALTAIGNAARELFRGAGALALLHLLYALLLASVYLFFATREANAWQLTATALLALAAPLLFFLLQAACVGYAGAGLGANAEAGATAGAEASATAGAAVGGVGLLRRALRTFWKLLLVSLPFLALALLFMYLLDKLDVRFPPPHPTEPVYAPRGPGGPPPPPVHWQTFVFPALHLLLLGVVVPLLGVHFWIAAARTGLKATVRNFFRVVARAFSAPSVFVYGVGLVVFAFMPYFLTFTRTSVSNGWLELFIFGLRLALAFVLTLWGWTITLGALTKLSLDGTTAARPDTAPATAPGVTPDAPEATTATNAQAQA